MKEGQTKKEAIRCLKRYIAREVYNNLPMEHLASKIRPSPDSAVSASA
jgi:hypothetical protein